MNSHDTYRPQLDGDGNITGWNTGDELAPHINPEDPRIEVVYALNFALDGNPLVFFEDLFNVQNTGKRYSHSPTNTVDLPQNTAIENLIWCHQNLDFKSGVYKVRGHSGNTGDHLIVERGGKAIIGANDNWTNWQGDWVDSDFAPGTVLKDYGNSTTTTVTVQNDQRVFISTPPCDGSAARRGYSVWAPVGQDNDNYTPNRSIQTTQEWEMADDLGDSHCLSLGQGGRLPNNSEATRTVGKIFVEANKNINIEVYGENTTNSVTLLFQDLSGNTIFEKSGNTPLIANYTATTTDWLIIKIKNTTANYNGQKCWVKAKYVAPKVVVTADYPRTLRQAFWHGKSNTDWLDCGNWEEGLRPNANLEAVILAAADHMPTISTNVVIKGLTLENNTTLTFDGDVTLNLRGSDLINEGNFSFINGCGKVKFTDAATDATAQTIQGDCNFCGLIINNAENVILNGSVSVSDALDFDKGNLELGNHTLTLGDTAIILDANENQYIITKNDATATGQISQFVSDAGQLFPIGLADAYAPISLATESGNHPLSVRVFENIYALGNQGDLIDGDSTVALTWALENNPNAVVYKVQLQSNTAKEGANFNFTNSTIAGFKNNKWLDFNATIVSPASPKTLAANDFVTDYQYFTIVSKEHSMIGGSAGNSGTGTGDFTAAPNPTDGALQLIANGSYPQGDIFLKIYSIDGKLVYQTSGNLSAINANLQTDFAKFNQGAYVLNIDYEGKMTRIKVLLVR